MKCRPGTPSRSPTDTHMDGGSHCPTSQNPVGGSFPPDPLVVLGSDDDRRRAACVDLRNYRPVTDTLGTALVLQKILHCHNDQCPNVRVLTSLF